MPKEQQLITFAAVALNNKIIASVGSNKDNCFEAVQDALVELPHLVPHYSMSHGGQMVLFLSAEEPLGSYVYLLMAHEVLGKERGFSILSQMQHSYQSSLLLPQKKGLLRTHSGPLDMANHHKKTESMLRAIVAQVKGKVFPQTAMVLYKDAPRAYLVQHPEPVEEIAQSKELQEEKRRRARQMLEEELRLVSQLEHSEVSFRSNSWSSSMMLPIMPGLEGGRENRPGSGRGSQTVSSLEAELAEISSAFSDAENAEGVVRPGSSGGSGGEGRGMRRTSSLPGGLPPLLVEQSSGAEGSGGRNGGRKLSFRDEAGDGLAGLLSAQSSSQSHVRANSKSDTFISKASLRLQSSGGRDGMQKPLMSAEHSESSSLSLPKTPRSRRSRNWSGEILSKTSPVAGSRPSQWSGELGKRVSPRVRMGNFSQLSKSIVFSPDNVRVSPHHDNLNPWSVKEEVLQGRKGQGSLESIADEGAGGKSAEELFSRLRPGGSGKPKGSKVIRQMKETGGAQRMEGGNKLPAEAAGMGAAWAAFSRVEIEEEASHAGGAGEAWGSSMSSLTVSPRPPPAIFAIGTTPSAAPSSGPAVESLEEYIAEKSEGKAAGGGRQRTPTKGSGRPLDRLRLHSPLLHGLNMKVEKKVGGRGARDASPVGSEASSHASPSTAAGHFRGVPWGKHWHPMRLKSHATGSGEDKSKEKDAVAVEREGAAQEAGPFDPSIDASQLMSPLPAASAASQLEAAKALFRNPVRRKPGTEKAGEPSLVRTVSSVHDDEVPSGKEAYWSQKFLAGSSAAMLAAGRGQGTGGQPRPRRSSEIMQPTCVGVVNVGGPRCGRAMTESILFPSERRAGVQGVAAVASSRSKFWFWKNRARHAGSDGRRGGGKPGEDCDISHLSVETLPDVVTEKSYEQIFREL